MEYRNDFDCRYSCVIEVTKSNPMCATRKTNRVYDNVFHNYLLSIWAEFCAWDFNVCKTPCDRRISFFNAGVDILQKKEKST